MEFHTPVLLDPAAMRLLALAERCAHEPASRQRDGEIYGAVHNIEDFNPFSGGKLWEAKRNGQTFVLHHGDRVEAPPFTRERKYAEMLLPEGLATICKEPRLACAVALRARAFTNAPPLRISSAFECRRR